MTRKPDWLRVRYYENPNVEAVGSILSDFNLNTVCREANCPNCSECFSRKTATFLILGTNCTRNCRFCNVRNGLPCDLDIDEPKNVAHATSKLGLKYIVVTSVTRDDLPDGGAGHFAKTISEIRLAAPDTVIEVLIPDFGGSVDALKAVTDAAPDVISHNMETVKLLYPDVRPEAQYDRSLLLLKNIKRLDPGIRSKSGFMVGLGETKEQVSQLLDDLREASCEILTIGQYLAPSKLHYPVREYIEPALFEEYGDIARKKGFDFVVSAPLVRSSYHADEAIYQ